MEKERKSSTLPPTLPRAVHAVIADPTGGTEPVEGTVVARLHGWGGSDFLS